jgi:hypothetical protein
MGIIPILAVRTLRALGAVREDELLIEQAAGRFDAMGLTWHAEQSRKLFAAR